MKSVCLLNRGSQLAVSPGVTWQNLMASFRGIVNSQIIRQATGTSYCFCPLPRRFKPLAIQTICASSAISIEGESEESIPSGNPSKGKTARVKKKTVVRKRKAQEKDHGMTQTAVQSEDALGTANLANKNGLAFLQPWATNGLAPQESHWEGVERWVVFSDLHLSRRTCQVCLEVLRRVHEEACQRDAGILFLGDFWHTRGALPVEPLNAALKELQSWTRPALFLTGNHDQVSVGGHLHGLTALEVANPLLRVVEAPLVFLEALWLPYRYDHAHVEKAVAENKGVKAIFCHVDVVGAFMNEAFQAKQGIEPAVFPPDIPVYTGHYHKPHVVAGTNIEYVGSPYQVSLSEAGQAKHFLVLDRNWQRIDEISIDVGPRNFVIPSGDVPSPETVSDLRSGDRLRWELPRGISQEAIKSHTEWMKERGVQVELLHPPPAIKLRIAAAEQLDAYSLFKAYAESVEMSSGGVEVALDIIRSLNLPPRLLAPTQSHIVFETVEVTGYGPFSEAVRYPLAFRGVRIVSGQNMDSNGADSNGAGKTTLVMAPLWAITGSTDPRPDSLRGLVASEVVHHNAMSARVRLEGTVNGVPFAVERTAGRRGGLKLWVGEEEKTCQEMRLTQERIEELLGDTQILQRAVFHGQHAAGSLLEANDKQFKEELSKVVVLDIWAAAKERSLEALRECRVAVERLEGGMEELQRQTALLAAQIEECRVREGEWKAARKLQLAALKPRLDFLRDSCQTWALNCDEIASLVSSQVKWWEGLELEGGKQGEEGAVEEHGKVEELRARKEQAWRRAVEADLEVQSAERSAKAAQRKVEAYRTGTVGALVCDMCQQPVDARHTATHLERLEQERTGVDRALQLALEAHLCQQRQLQEAEAALQAATEAQAQAVLARHRAVQKRQTEEQEMRGEVQLAGQLVSAARQLLARAQLQAPAAAAVARQLEEASELEPTLTGETGGEADSRLVGVPGEALSETHRTGAVSPGSHVSDNGSGFTDGSHMGELSRPEAGGALVGESSFSSQRGASRHSGAVADGLPYDVASSFPCNHSLPCHPSQDPPLTSGNQSQANACDRLRVTTAALKEELERGGRLVGDLGQALERVTQLANERSPLATERQVLEGLYGERTGEAAKKNADLGKQRSSLEGLKEVDTAFGLGGVQSYILEGALAELQDRVARYLEALSGGTLSLLLAPTKAARSSNATLERITKTAMVRLADGRLVQRSIRQLSGGEQRRLALALALAYAEFAAERSGVHCDLMVLDEVLQHLDGEGKARMASVLQSLPHRTVLVVSQAHSEISGAFVCVDWVVKDGDTCRVQLAEDCQS